MRGWGGRGEPSAMKRPKARFSAEVDLPPEEKRPAIRKRCMGRFKVLTYGEKKESKTPGNKPPSGRKRPASFREKRGNSEIRS